MSTTIRDWPFITTDVRGDGTVEVVIAGTKKLTSDLDAAIELIHRDAATRMQRPVRVRLSSAGVSTGTLIVTPEATYYLEDAEAEVRPVGRPAEPEPAPEPAAEAEPVDQPEAAVATASPEPVVEPAFSAPVAEPAAAPAPQPEPIAAPTSSEPEMSAPPERPAAAEPTPTASPQVTARPAAHRSDDADLSPMETIRARSQQDEPDESRSSVYRRSFIHEDPAQDLAELGWRARFNRMGLHLAPGRKERELLDYIETITTPFTGPRTVAVGNPKGSANKTPTTAMLSAVFARFGRSGVLAWDNNETRGSLAWRTQASNHDATVIEVLKVADELLSATAQAAELNRYTHHQIEDKYDVLRSDQSVDGDHEVSGEDVSLLHQIASHYYRLIVMDSGNNERAANWRAMIERADVLVVPLTNSEDTAEAGARMLEALSRRGEHARALAQKAVAIVSQRTPGKDAKTARIARDFAPLVREVTVIPYDPEMNASTLIFDKLAEPTQRAWIAAAALVAEGL